MDQDSKELLHKNGVFGWIALATAGLLLIPLVATQLTSEVNWTVSDFIVMAVLLFGMTSLFVLAARKSERKYRTLIGGLFLAAFLYIWAELAVGIFTNLGS